MRRAILWTIMGILVAGTAAIGQNRGPGQCCADGTPASILGQPVELKGKVVSVQITPGEGMPFVTIKTGDQVVKVYLGSMRYLMAQGLNPKVNEEIAVKAYKMDSDFVAATVTLPDQNKTVRLRDENGIPLWRGGRWGGPAR